jgi:hypothetical protein
MKEFNEQIYEWMDSIGTLYDNAPLRAQLMPTNPKNSSYWFHSCVRQIRLFARQMEAGNNQYAAVLAMALLRKATKDLTAAEPESSRRAVAYVMAERVLLKTFQQ